MAQRPHRAGSAGPLVALAVALVALLALSGCAYNTAATATTTSAPHVATSPHVLPSEAAAPVQTALPGAPAPRVASVAKPVNHCAKNTAAQWVLVSVTEQHAWMCQGTRAVYSAAVTTGAVDLPYRDTPIGTFAIQGKYTDQTLTLDTGAQYQVKYWIPFQGPLYGFHDSPWQTFPLGSAKYRTQGSHGCVHLGIKTITFLYGWANIGTPVTIKA